MQYVKDHGVHFSHELRTTTQSKFLIVELRSNMQSYTNIRLAIKGYVRTDQMVSYIEMYREKGLIDQKLHSHFTRFIRTTNDKKYCKLNKCLPMLC